MEGLYELLEHTLLFRGIKENELKEMLKCLSSVKRQYTKDTYIFSAHEPPSTVGVLLSGSVNIIQEDFWGNRSILGNIRPGEVFGEAFVCAGVQSLPVSVVAQEASQVLFIDYHKIIDVCSCACHFHNHLIQNMVGILARKNVMLTQKVEHMAKRTIRDKLLSYLSLQAISKGSESFQIPFNRQELADYLSVDRSALSAELSKLQKEEILQFHKNQFLLRHP